MSDAGLQDLLAALRDHPCFPELLAAIRAQLGEPRPFRPGAADVAQQQAEWIFYSGRQYQVRAVLDLLTSYAAKEEHHERRRQTATRG